MAVNTDVSGECSPRFERVADGFRARFAAGEEIGAAVCIYHKGVPVVDLWGGTLAADGKAPWEMHSAVPIMSTSKAITAVCIHLLAERDMLDLEAPVARYWPGFAANGKADITLSQILGHSAGIPALDAPLTHADLVAHTPLLDAIAAQAPQWTPGTRHGYHPLTGGWILAEVVRQVTGRTLTDFVAEDLAGPLELNLSIGNRDPARSIARLRMPTTRPEDPALAKMTAAFADPSSLTLRAFANPSLAPYDINSPEVQRLEIPSGNGIADARSLARLYAALLGRVDGVRLWNDATLHHARRAMASGEDAVLLCRTDYSRGFLRPGGPMFPDLGFGCFGHGGTGGSIAFADAETGLSFAYVMNAMSPGPGGGARTAALVRAMYASLA